jgi:DNA-binding MarR family transcriptional regulator
MNASARPDGYRAPGKDVLGRLTVQEFDVLELIGVMGGHVTVAQLALRWGAKENTAGRRMQRMVRAGLVDQQHVLVENRTRGVRIVIYSISETGVSLFREALAALDAACGEAA